MDGASESELQAHEFMIRHGGVESGPFTMVRLREMWASGELDGTTKFMRLDLGYWVDADDLVVELEFSPSDESEGVVQEEIATPEPDPPSEPPIAQHKPAIASAPTVPPPLVNPTTPLKPYEKPILPVILQVIAGLVALVGILMVLPAANMERAGGIALVMASFPTFFFAIVLGAFAQLVDYVARTAHFAQQSAELLNRELPAMRAAAEMQRKD